MALYRDFRYRESQTVPTVKINPEFVFGPRDELWSYDNFYIHEGYHSYLTEEMAKCSRDDEIGIFEIPAGATIYVNYKRREVVSTDIKYLGLLEEYNQFGGYLCSCKCIGQIDKETMNG